MKIVKLTLLFVILTLSVVTSSKMSAKNKHPHDLEMTTKCKTLCGKSTTNLYWNKGHYYCVCGSTWKVADTPSSEFGNVDSTTKDNLKGLLKLKSALLRHVFPSA